MKNTAVGAHRITADFEQALADYLGSPFVVAVDSCTSAIALCLMRENVKGTTIEIPKHTFMSAPCEIILAGAKVSWRENPGNTLTGAYQFWPTRIYDSALRFTANQYVSGQLQCVSMTGPNKILKLGIGGAILCDNEDDFNYFKKVRNSGRSECSYHEDAFTMVGRKCYMNPSIAALGLLLMPQFYSLSGGKIHNKDLELPYPDLSLHPAYK